MTLSETSARQPAHDAPRLSPLAHATTVAAPAAEPALLAVAERARADCIALGTHGHGALRRLAFGSVTAELVRDGRWSLLVVPAEHAT